MCHTWMSSAALVAFLGLVPQVIFNFRYLCLLPEVVFTFLISFLSIPIRQWLVSVQPSFPWQCPLQVSTVLSHTEMVENRQALITTSWSTSCTKVKRNIFSPFLIPICTKGVKEETRRLSTSRILLTTRRRAFRMTERKKATSWLLPRTRTFNQHLFQPLLPPHSHVSAAPQGLIMQTLRQGANYSTGVSYFSYFSNFSYFSYFSISQNILTLILSLIFRCVVVAGRFFQFPFLCPNGTVFSEVFILEKKPFIYNYSFRGARNLQLVVENRLPPCARCASMWFSSNNIYI